MSGYAAFFYYRLLDRLLHGVQGHGAAMVLSTTVDMMVRAESHGDPKTPGRLSRTHETRTRKPVSS